MYSNYHSYCFFKICILSSMTFKFKKRMIIKTNIEMNHILICIWCFVQLWRIFLQIYVGFVLNWKWQWKLIEKHISIVPSHVLYVVKRNRFHRRFLTKSTSSGCKEDQASTGTACLVFIVATAVSTSGFNLGYQGFCEYFVTWKPDNEL